MKVSYSSLTQYQECPRKYKLNRIDKLRPNTLNSALLFGRALDVGVEGILKNNENYYQEFMKEMLTTKVLKQVVDVPKSLKIKYSKKDLQIELIDSVNRKLAENYSEELGFKDIDLENFVKNYNSNDEKSFKLNQYLCWLSLCKKGEMLLDHFLSWASKNIEDVICIQKKIKLSNDHGDEFTGFLDFKAKFKDGITRIVDLKTSSDPKRYYPDGCANTSPQLVIYAEEDETYNTAYYILDKVIRKREPRIRDRYVTGYVEPNVGNEVFNKLESTLEDIKRGEFPPNYDSCFNYGKCEYYNFCKKGSEDGLIYLTK